MITRGWLARIALYALLVAPAFDLWAQSVTVQPGPLLSREAVTIRVSTAAPFALGRESVSMVNNKITVTMRSYENAPDPGPSPPSSDVLTSSADVVVGKLPQGSYTVDVLYLYRPLGTFGFVGSTQFTVGDDVAASAANYPAYDYTDIWWNPNESGWGIAIHVKRNTLFAAWFAYDSLGQPTWYTYQSGRWEMTNKYVGTIYATHSNPNAGLGPLTTLSVTPVGDGTITFNANNQATFDFTVNGFRNSKKHHSTNVLAPRLKLQKLNPSIHALPQPFLGWKPQGCWGFHFQPSMDSLATTVATQLAR